MTINYDVVGRSDEQIREQYANDATKLSVEEMLYAATLTDNAAEKEAIYKKTAQYWDKDYRALNNLAVLAFNQGDNEQADRYLQQALRVNKQAPEAYANLGLIALKQGKLSEAEEHIANAIGANGFGEALGNLNIAKGNFAQAEASFDGAVSKLYDSNDFLFALKYRNLDSETNGFAYAAALRSDDIIVGFAAFVGVVMVEFRRTEYGNVAVTVTEFGYAAFNFGGVPTPEVEALFGDGADIGTCSVVAADRREIVSVRTCQDLVGRGVMQSACADAESHSHKSYDCDSKNFFHGIPPVYFNSAVLFYHNRRKMSRCFH